MKLSTVVLVLFSVSAALASVAKPPRRGERLEWFFASRLDANNDGVVDIDELPRYFNAIESGMGTHFADQMGPLMERYDVDGDGQWSEKEFTEAFRAMDAPNLTNAPEQLHLMVQSRDAWVVSWVTVAESNATATTVVEWGTAPSSLAHSAAGFARTYSEWKEGLVHFATMSPLTAGTTYYYRVGGNLGWSDVYNFTTESTEKRPVRFVVGGDMGVAIPSGYRVMEEIEKAHRENPFDMMIHNGDLAYASTAVSDDGGVSKKDNEWQWVWDMWCNQIEPIARTIPYVVGVGNHEKFYNYTSYLTRFEMPSPWGTGTVAQSDSVSRSATDKTVFWFSLDYGYAHFVLMSSEHDYSPGSPQYEWIKADLIKANANRDQTPFVFLTAHRPMYSSDKSEYSSHTVGGELQEHIEPLMLEYGVDGYLCGHMHMYERVHPVRNGTVVARDPSGVYTKPSAPVHVVQGTYGVFQDYKFVDPAPEWSADRQSKIGYAVLEIFNATTFHYEFRSVDSGSVVDEFWLNK